MKTSDTVDLNSQALQNGLYLDLVAASAPSTPSSSRGRLYLKTDKTLAMKNDAGAETQLGALVSRVASDVTTTGASTAVTGLTATLAAGATYSFEVELFLSVSDNAQSAYVHLNNSTTGSGGQATKTDLRAGWSAFGIESGLPDVAQVKTAMNQSFLTGTANGDSTFIARIAGTITVNSGGTFGPYLGSSDAGNTATVKRGSWMRITPNP